MNSNFQEFFVVFDTNVLYRAYDKKADFSSFSFNTTYENIVGFINQLDIYEQVVIIVPTVVWKEMEQQIIESHQQKIKDFRERISKFSFPEIKIKDENDFDYNAFIHSIMEKYRSGLSSDINKVIEISIASEARYSSIISRAFDKRPPFEGKDKKSDKGFKDALLWESILEFAAQHNTAKFIYYSKDNGFSEELEKEFVSLFPNARISISSTENAVKEELESWARDIDIYSYTPIENYVEHQELIDWLQSEDFLIQMIDRDYGIIEKSRLITDTAIHLISFDNVQITNQTEENTEYSIDVNLELMYTLKEDTKVSEKIDITIMVSHVLGELFMVEDVYIPDEKDIDNGVVE